MAKIHIKTLGCKVNSYDSSALGAQLEAASHVLLPSGGDADAIIINSCSVTANAEKETRYLARRYKREQASRKVIVAGCYAQTDSATLEDLDSIDFVIPNSIKERSGEYVDQFLAGKFTTKLPPDIDAVRSNRQGHFKSSLTLFAETKRDRARAVIKIQDGCNGFCSYCLIPYARGASRSVEPDLIVDAVRRLVSEGVREIVVTGIHVGDYGRDLPQFDGLAYPITKLLRQVFAIPGFRLRISSLEPSEVSDELVELLAEFRSRVCPHFHLPLQSGCDAVLRRMRRTYSKDEYQEACTKLRRAFPGVNLGADVIPGFPGETDDQHAETMRYIEQLGLSYLHVFPYSPRPNTAAMRLDGHVDQALVKQRAKELRDLSDRLSHHYGTTYLNRQLEVIWDDQTDELGRQRGRSDNYLQVVADAGRDTEPGVLSEVTVAGWVGKNTLLGVSKAGYHTL